MFAARIFKALSDTNRLRALAVLRERPLCVCQIVELLGLAPSTVSKHMSVLAGAGLVESEKRGRWVFYRLARNENDEVVKVLELLPGLLNKEPWVREDQKALSRILELDPENLCRIQGERKERDSEIFESIRMDDRAVGVGE